MKNLFKIVSNRQSNKFPIDEVKENPMAKTTKLNLEAIKEYLKENPKKTELNFSDLQLTTQFLDELTDFLKNNFSITKINFDEQQTKTFANHDRWALYPVWWSTSWMPAFAGMTLRS